MKKIKRKILSLGIACALVGSAFGLAACSNGTGNTSSSSDTSNEEYPAINMDAMDFDYTDRDKDASYDESSATKIALDGNAAQINGSGAQSDGATVTVSEEGTYIITGTLSNGQIVVNTPDTEKVQLVLNGVQINNSNGPAIYINQTDKCFITLAPESTNTLTDGTDYALEDGEDEPNATLFSKEDLTINGSGVLNITSSYRHAVNSKDDLVITGGIFEISSSEDALRGKDCVKILDGIFNIQAGEDAIKSNNDNEADRGYICIDGGDYTINAGDDAIHAETVLMVNNGVINVQSCEEGYEAEQIYITGSDTQITSNDDALNASARGPSNSNAQDSGANGDMGAGAMPGDNAQDPNATNSEAPQDPSANGDMGPGAMPGNDAQNPNATNSEVPQDFTMNGGKGFGAMTGNASDRCILNISGGTIVLNASGDGVDSNGTIEISGGVLLVNGPTSNADGALDYEISANISGGTVLMVGSSGMAETFSSAEQAFIFTQASGRGGELITITDSAGNVLISFTPAKDFQTILASAPGMTSGTTYNVTVNGNTTQAEATLEAQPGAGMGQGRGGNPNMNGEGAPNMNGGGRQNMNGQGAFDGQATPGQRPNMNAEGNS